MTKQIEPLKPFNADGPRVHLGNVKDDGSCNFCTGDASYSLVWVISGNSLQVRVCMRCMKKLRTETKHLFPDSESKMTLISRF